MSRTHTGNRGYCVHCDKFIHKTSAAAFGQRKQLIAKGKHNKREGALTIYRCPHGFGWHVGHTTRVVDK